MFPTVQGLIHILHRGVIWNFHSSIFMVFSPSLELVCSWKCLLISLLSFISSAIETFCLIFYLYFCKRPRSSMYFGGDISNSLLSYHILTVVWQMDSLANERSLKSPGKQSCPFFFPIYVKKLMPHRVSESKWYCGSTCSRYFNQR